MERSASGPSRGEIVTALRATGELAGAVDLLALRVAEVVQPRTRSSRESNWPPRS